MLLRRYHSRSPDEPDTEPDEPNTDDNAPQATKPAGRSRSGKSTKGE
ncbi:hypothetical protein ACFXOY_04630 [Streptomyces niveus]